MIEYPKCKCGNQVGQARVNPFPIEYIPAGKKEPVVLVYNGGHDQHGNCWFCAFPRRKGWMND